MSDIFAFINKQDVFFQNLFSLTHYPFLDETAPWITDILVSVGFVATLVFLAHFSRKARQFEILWAFIVSSAGSLFVSSLVKEVVARPRPSGGIVLESLTHSFPSNHSAFAMGVYGFLFFLLNDRNLPKRQKIFFQSLLVLLVLAVGISRLYVGVHYFSDVISGYVIGLIFAYLSTKIVKRIENDEV